MNTIRLSSELLYSANLQAIWNSFLPVPDEIIIKNDGTTEPTPQTITKIFFYYTSNLAQLALALPLLPITWTLSSIASLSGRVTYQKPPQDEELPSDFVPPEHFGFANSGFQDGGIGTPFDRSRLQGTSDWNKILNRPPQRVTENGRKLEPITGGITLQEGERIEDLFVDIMDYPKEFADLLRKLGCTGYRISLERSVIEATPNHLNDTAIKKYQALFNALKEAGIEPYVTLHHFTNPQSFEDRGGFTRQENIDGFVEYCKQMIREFPMVKHWMTFNEPGIRGLEAYVRGEHPPQQENIATASQVIRNLLIAHTKAYKAMKEINSELKIGITHQWLKFLPFSGNPIERIVAYFFTNLIHTPVFEFFKTGQMRIAVPFRAHVILRYEDDKTAKKIADFLGVQAYGFPRIKIGWNGGVPHPGAADKVQNFTIPRLRFGFTTGSTCGPGDSIQYFGPPAQPEDLREVLNEASSIPKERIPEIGITETGADAYRMKFGERTFTVKNEEQAQDYEEIFSIIENYPLTCFFPWTLNRHCEWLSGSMPHLGVTKLHNENDGTISYKKTPAITVIAKKFHDMRNILFQNQDAVA